jgi:hypothetical protein
MYEKNMSKKLVGIIEKYDEIDQQICTLKGKRRDVLLEIMRFPSLKNAPLIYCRFIIRCRVELRHAWGSSLDKLKKILGEL